MERHGTWAGAGHLIQARDDWNFRRLDAVEALLHLHWIVKPAPGRAGLRKPGLGTATTRDRATIGTFLAPCAFKWTFLSLRFFRDSFFLKPDKILKPVIKGVMKTAIVLPRNSLTNDKLLTCV